MQQVVSGISRSMWVGPEYMWSSRLAKTFKGIYFSFPNHCLSAFYNITVKCLIRASLNIYSWSSHYFPRQCIPSLGSSNNLKTLGLQNTNHPYPPKFILPSVIVIEPLIFTKHVTLEIRIIFPHVLCSYLWHVTAFWPMG